MNPRQKRLNELARRAWPGQSVEVVSPDEGAVHIWDEQGRVLLHCVHPFAEALLAMLAGDVASAPVGVCLDIADFVVREHAHQHAVDVIGWREGRIVLWDERGKLGDGFSLRVALENVEARKADDDEQPRLQAAPSLRAMMPSDCLDTLMRRGDKP